MNLHIKVKTLFNLICLFFASCGDSKHSLSNENKKYEGRWTTTNNNYILIKDDGGCDCAIGGVK